MTALTSVPAADVRIELKGRITAYTAAPIWRSALETLAGNPDRPIIVDASQVEYADGVGIAFLFDLIRRDRPGTAPAAVLAVRFALIDQLGPHPKVVVQRVIARRVELPRASPDALVRGYGNALAEILDELSTELQVVAK